MLEMEGHPTIRRRMFKEHSSLFRVRLAHMDKFIAIDLMIMIGYLPKSLQHSLNLNLLAIPSTAYHHKNAKIRLQ